MSRKLFNSSKKTIRSANGFRDLLLSNVLVVRGGQILRGFCRNPYSAPRILVDKATKSKHSIRFQPVIDRQTQMTRLKWQVDGRPLMTIYFHHGASDSLFITRAFDECLYPTKLNLWAMDLSKNR